MEPEDNRGRTSALRYFGKFARAGHDPQRPLFRRPSVFGEIDPAVHNERTFILFAAYLSDPSTISDTTGRPLEPRTRKSYVESAVAALKDRFGAWLVPSKRKLKRILEHSLAGLPAGDRAKGTGVRLTHIRGAIERGMPTTASANIANALAMALSAIRLFLRGGEPQYIRERDVRFERCGGDDACVIINVLPLKKRGRARGQRVPMRIFPARRAGAPDAACAFAAIRRLLVIDAVGRNPNGTGPFFRIRQGAGWRPFATTDVAAHAQYVARHAGVPHESVGGKAYRIGGATDHADGGGTPLELRQQGRWDSDLAFIYARVTTGQQRAAHEAMQRANTVTVESLHPEWTQPGAN